jgi:bacteriorhodopsin
MSKEKYDANGNVCDSQDDFNQAFRAAIKYNNQQNMKGAWVWVYVGLWAVFLIWGIILSMKVEDENERKLHMVFAIVASPAYVLAYYLSMLSKGKSANMGMCGARHY